jgi:hypothetical protein
MSSRPTIRSRRRSSGKPRRSWRRFERSSRRMRSRLSKAKINWMRLMNLKKNVPSPEAIPARQRRNRAPKDRPTPRRFTRRKTRRVRKERRIPMRKAQANR